jgi:hypothetical protein
MKRARSTVIAAQKRFSRRAASGIKMEPRTRPEVPETRCTSCGAALTSQTHVGDCLLDRVDAVHYVGLFWEEA